MEIRAYAPEHLGAVAALWLDSHRSTGLEDDGVTVEALAARIPQEIAGGWETWLAWDGDRLLAFMALRLADACLDQLFVAPEAQGTGVGSDLLDLAKTKMPDGFWLRTAAANAGGRAFYERRGLRHAESGVHPDHGRPIVIYRWP